MKRVSVYERKRLLFAQPMSRTVAGLWVHDGPCVTISESVPIEEIGQAVLGALSASRIGVAHPTSWADLTNALAQAAGVRNWNAFAKSARCVNVELDDELVLMPTQNRGSKEGFVDVEQHVSKLSASALPVEIGRALLGALAMSMLQDVRMK